MRVLAATATVLTVSTAGLFGGSLASGAPSGNQPLPKGLESGLRDSKQRDDRRQRREAARARREKPQASGLKRQSDAEAMETATEQSPELFGPAPTTALSLKPGDRVGKYLSDYSARILDKDGEPAGLVTSTIPLRVEDEQGRDVATDLDLEKTGTGFESEAPVVPVEYPAQATGELTVGDQISFRFADAKEGSTARIASQQVFWPNAMTDTDLMATPLPAGVETFAQLRSENSPQRLRMAFDLPDGARLREALDSAGKPSGWIEIIREGKTLAQLPPAISVDANEEPVESTYKITGDTLDVLVEHGPGSAYPILVDPAVVDYNFANGPSNANGGVSDAYGWFRSSTNVPLNYFSFVPGSDNGPSGGGCPRPSGASTVTALCVGAYYGAPYGSLSLGQWTWRPPAGSQTQPTNPDGSLNDAYIYRMDMRSAFLQTANSYLYAGLIAPRTNTWVGTSNNEYGQDVRGNPYTLSYSNTSFYRTYCLSGGCAEAQSDPNIDGTYAAFGIGAYGSNSGGVATMQGSAMYQSDRSAPDIGFAFDQNQWHQGGTTSVILSGRDRGMGMSSGGLYATGKNGTVINPTSTSSCNGTRTNRCQPFRSDNYPLSASDFNEGINTITAAVSDILGKGATQNLNFKVDRSNPSSVGLSGSLLAVADDDARGSYSVAVDAKDSLSGVRRLELFVDGQSVTATMAGTQVETQGDPGTGGGMQRSLDFNTATLTDGAHNVTVRATDGVGLTRDSDPVRIYVDQTAPSFDDGLKADTDFDDAANETRIDWVPAGDPSGPDGSRGSGIENYLLTYKINGGQPSARVLIENDAVWTEITGAQVGDVLDLTITPVDGVGNVGAPSTETVTVGRAATLDDNEDPDDPTLNDAVPTITPDGNDFEQTAPEGTLLPDDEDDTADLEGDPDVQSRGGPGRYRVKVTGAGWATVRNKAGSLVIGNAKTQGTFDVKKSGGAGRRPSAFFGRVYGNLNGCGWVFIANAATRTSNTVQGSCGTSDLAPRRFSKLINCDKCNRAEFIKMRTTLANGDPMPATVPIYRNVRPFGTEKGADKRFKLSTTNTNGTPTRVSWRYATRGGDFLLVNAKRYLPREDGDSAETSNGWSYISTKYFRDDLCDGKTPKDTTSTRHRDWPKVCEIGAPPMKKKRTR